MSTREKADRGKRHWRQNLRLVGILLALWFIVSYGCGIIWVEELNAFFLGGFPLGFWFAQQGSTIVFIALIAVYCLRMDKIDEQARHNEGPK